MSHSDTRRCGECEALLMDEGYLCEDCHSDYMGWLMEQDYRRGHGAGPYTVTDRLRWLRRSVPSSMSSASHSPHLRAMADAAADRAYWEQDNDEEED